MINPKEAAEDYANLKIWLNPEGRPEQEFHEYIAKIAWLEGYEESQKQTCSEIEQFILWASLKAHIYSGKFGMFWAENETNEMGTRNTYSQKQMWDMYLSNKTKLSQQK